MMSRRRPREQEHAPRRVVRIRLDDDHFRFFDGLEEALLVKIPAGKLGEGSDIAAAVTYLASNEASYVTGQTLHVNGGMAMY